MKVLLLLFNCLFICQALPMSKEERETWHRVNEWKSTDKVNPEELGHYFEGDIIVGNDKDNLNRSGLLDESKRWPNGVVPYCIQRNHFSSYEKKVIEYGMLYITWATSGCIKFKKRTYENDYVDFRSDKSGCYSYAGKWHGAQPINLQTPGCTSARTVMHEIIHALGFHHEQKRPDADYYVDIQWDNIKKGKRHNFEICPYSYCGTFNTYYDYKSIMHYSQYAFSKNGKPTIITKDSSYKDKIGRYPTLSRTDIQDLKNMYKCK